MSYLEELLPKFRKGAKIRCNDWIDGGYIQKVSDDIINQNNYSTVIPSEDVLSNKWELYQESIDWEYIIKNKCLCRFSDGDDDFVLGTLSTYNEAESVFYCESYRGTFVCCRPVRKNEVTFYEDRKDGNN